MQNLNKLKKIVTSYLKGIVHFVAVPGRELLRPNFILEWFVSITQQAP